MGKTVLIVEDDSGTRELVADYLSEFGYEVIQTASGQKGLELFDRRSPESSILDLHLPGLSGLKLLEQFKQRDPNHPVIVISGTKEIETAVKAMKGGACEYLSKPINLEALKLALEKALTENRLEQTITYLVSEKEQEFRQETVIAASPAMKAVLASVQQVASSPATTVLITGESGTGKEVIAKAIHYYSPQKKQPFIEINCSAVPETLMESELFGHERGAFTDAKTRKQGLLELADGGTFLLDEIGEMPLSLQTKLLKVLEERSFRRIGGVKNIQVELRIIAATNTELHKLVENGKFRTDLYYRLNVISIHLPPLRERNEDIHLLANHFLEFFNRSYRRSVKGFDEDALYLLNAYPWPGNVRELRNAVERAVMINGNGWICPRDLNIERRNHPRPTASELPVPNYHLQLPEVGISFAQIEKDAILQALQRCGGNVSKAARFLRISRQTIRYRMSKLGIHFEELEPAFD
ncbi:MAG: sigma-54 dependent transcriptional regulator [bacterium]